MSVYDFSESDLVDAFRYLAEYLRYSVEDHGTLWTDKDGVTQRFSELLGCIITKGSRPEYVWENLTEFIKNNQVPDMLRALDTVSALAVTQSLSEQDRILALVRLLLSSGHFLPMFTGFSEGTLQDVYSENGIINNQKRRDKIVKSLVRITDLGVQFQLDAIAPSDVAPETLAFYQLALAEKKALRKEKADLDSSHPGTTPTTTPTNLQTSSSAPVPPTPTVAPPSVVSPVPNNLKVAPVLGGASDTKVAEAPTALNVPDLVSLTQTSKIPNDSKPPQVVSPSQPSSSDVITFSRGADKEDVGKPTKTAAPKSVVETPVKATVSTPVLAKPETVTAPAPVATVPPPTEATTSAAVPNKPVTPPAPAPDPVIKPASAVPGAPVNAASATQSTAAAPTSSVPKQQPSYPPSRALLLDNNVSDAALLKSLTKTTSVQLIAGVPVNITPTSGGASTRDKIQTSGATKMQAVKQPTIASLQSKDKESKPAPATVVGRTATPTNTLQQDAKIATKQEAPEVKSIFARTTVLDGEKNRLLTAACPNLMDEMKRITRRVANVELATDDAGLPDGIYIDVLSEISVERAMLSKDGDCEIVSFTGKALIDDVVDSYWVKLASIAESWASNKGDKHKGSAAAVPSAPACFTTNLTFSVDHYTFDNIVVRATNSSSPLVVEESNDINTYTYNKTDYTRPADIKAAVHSLQDDKCAGCNTSLANLSIEEFSSLLFCCYNGKVHCKDCSLIVNKHIIPAKMLSTKRDLTEYTVSATSYKLLEKYWKRPNLETIHLISARLDLDAAFNDYLHKRTKLNLCYKKSDTCQELTSIFATEKEHAYYYKHYAQSDGTNNFYWASSDIVLILSKMQLPIVERLIGSIQAHSATCATCQSIF